MKSVPPLTFFFVVMLSVFTSCGEKDKSVACTLEFRQISVKITGEKLDEWYTIRLKNNDTIRWETGHTAGAEYYPVLDDSYQPKLEGKTEEFRFLGFKNNVMLVNEPFIISADKCHINLVNGKSEINL
ncbi:MAG: hypothetical protein LC117_05310 [Bacteroidia bacterium]|nr:hypothetical protein [Bacteroidia bacterium]